MPITQTQRPVERLDGQKVLWLRNRKAGLEPASPELAFGRSIAVELHPHSVSFWLSDNPQRAAHRNGNGQGDGIRTRTVRVTGGDANYYITTLMKWPARRSADQAVTWHRPAFALSSYGAQPPLVASLRAKAGASGRTRTHLRQRLRRGRPTLAKGYGGAGRRIRVCETRPVAAEAQRR